MKLQSLKQYRPIGILGLIALVVLAIILAGGTNLASASNWEASYWNNPNLSGSPEIVRQDTEINFDWGALSPAPTVNVDNFSARWLSTINVGAPGVYRFSATMDDGMRVWVDGKLVIDSWFDGKVRTETADINLNSGPHSVRVEYYEAGGNAVARFAWGPVTPPSGGAIFNWRGEYFTNRTLSGTPAVVRDDAAINFDWGTGAPAEGIPMDNFSVRWTRTVTLDSGRYRFTLTTDDGARVWIGNRQIFDEWRNQAVTTFTVDVDLNAGSYPIRMDYYDDQGAAVAKLSWTRTGDITGQPPQPPKPQPPQPPQPGNWRGEYYNNRALSGTPALVRSDARIDFNWGFGSPSPIINSDNFSVRWTQTLNLPAGRYRFTTATDDGVRLFVNNQLIIDEWFNRAVQTTQRDINLSGGNVDVRMEYYEATQRAEARLSWRQISGEGGTGGPQPTAVVTASYLNVRRGPGVNFGVAATIRRNTEVNLAGRNSDASWVQISAPGVSGWVNPRYLNTSFPLNNLPDTAGRADELPTANVTAFHLNMRHGPGVQYGVILTIHRNQIVTLLGRAPDGQWVKIRLPSGTEGWVNGRYLTGSENFNSLPVVR